MQPGESESHPERAHTPTLGIGTEGAGVPSPNHGFGLGFYVPVEFQTTREFGQLQWLRNLGGS